MTSQAYDNKNEQDYDNITDAIDLGLDKIESTPSLKPTIAELAKLSGVHRNTISKRGTPKNTLKRIKKERRIRAEIDKEDKKDEAKTLEDQLDNAKIELIHWFTKSSSLETENEQLTISLKRFNDSLEFYKNELKKEKDKNTALQEEINLLKG